MPDLISCTQAAKERKLHASTVRNLAAAGVIPGAVKVGPVWVIPGDAKIPVRKRGQRGPGLIPAGEILPGVAAATKK